MSARLCFPFKKIALPEAFANINANQKYNRVTIAELCNGEKAIADSLINKDKITHVHRDNYIQFLSPVEFETLIFLIFTKSGSSLCSSFRGGTLKEFDLKISLSDNSYDIPIGDYWIQVKKKNMNNKLKKYTKQKDNEILIHCGKEECISKRILGVDWLTKQIDLRPDILKWLENMTFKNDKVFNFSWKSPNN